ncbi:hypothetical protein FRC20_009460 [Serendipita sp. 405]|nr:hypothetical protein FRC20_009460 [Serendipita sp. 405]
MSLHHLQVPLANRGSFDVLERERSAVLSELGGTRHHNGDLDALKMRYNQIIYEQWKLRCGCWSDPLVVFPRDIVTIIFQCLDGQNVDEYRVKDLLNCLNVSQLWLSVLADSPSLWANIVIDDEEGDQLANVAICLELSKSSPLKLIINRCTPQEWEEVSMLLLPHADRIKEVNWVSLQSRWFMKQCIESLQNLPALQRIYLPRMNIFYYSRDIVTALSMVPNLREISCLQMDLNREYELGPMTDIRIILPPRLGTEHHLPHNWERLRHLNLIQRGNNANSEAIFKTLECCPNGLTSLVVSGVPAGNLIKLLTYIRRYALEKLSLIINYDRTAPQPDYLLQQSNPLPVRSVDITFNDKTGRGMKDWPEWLIDMLAVSMPYTEDLLLQVPSLPLAAISSLKKLPLLRRLEIHGDILWRAPSTPICLLTAVETFVYHGRQFPHDLQPPGESRNPLLFPNLINCTLGTRLDKDRKGRRVPPHAALLPKSSSQSLVRLYIRLPNGPTPSLSHLPVLEELALGDHLGFPKKYPVWQSDILEQLILQPKACRFLRRIEFHSPYVEWDMLILALERRNFLEDPSVRLIDEIDFRFAPPSSKLLTLITSLLAGVFVERLPLHQYSFAAVARNFSSDSSTHSCLACLTVFKGDTNDESNHPIFEQMNEIDESDMEHLFAVSDPPLPDLIRLWLAGRVSRYHAARGLCEDAEEKGKELTRCPSHRWMKVTAFSSGNDPYIDIAERFEDLGIGNSSTR